MRTITPARSQRITTKQLAIFGREQRRVAIKTKDVASTSAPLYAVHRKFDEAKAGRLEEGCPDFWNISHPQPRPQTILFQFFTRTGRDTVEPGEHLCDADCVLLLGCFHSDRQACVLVQMPFPREHFPEARPWLRSRPHRDSRPEPSGVLEAF